MDHYRHELEWVKRWVSRGPEVGKQRCLERWIRKGTIVGLEGVGGVGLGMQRWVIMD